MSCNWCAPGMPFGRPRTRGVSRAADTRRGARDTAGARASTGPARPWPSASSTRWRLGYAVAASAARSHGYVLRPAAGRSCRRLSRGVVGDRHRLRARRSRPRAPTSGSRSQGERLARRVGDARRRRARGGGAGRVLRGRLQRQRARPREADRHRAAADPRRNSPGASIVVGDGPGVRAVRDASTPRSNSSGTTPRPAPSTRRSPASPSPRSRRPSSPLTVRSSRRRSTPKRWLSPTASSPTPPKPHLKGDCPLLSKRHLNRDCPA